MRILFLDSASREHSLALVEGEKTVLLKTLPLFKENSLVPLLEESLREIGWQYTDLTHLACIKGPGGFASLRTGITAVNTLVYALGIPLTGVHLSEVWKERVRARAGTSPSPKPNPDPNFFWLHSTRKHQLFVHGFGDYAKKFPEPLLLTLEEAAKLQGMYVGELLDEQKIALVGCTLLEKKYIAPLAEILPSLLKPLSYTKETVLPWYGREA